MSADDLKLISVLFFVAALSLVAGALLRGSVAAARPRHQVLEFRLVRPESLVKPVTPAEASGIIETGMEAINP
jgi:hypothetical protein